ncbi:MAG: PD40 domain-containing protein [Armatimonadetes bacterium]|nr:PD40 domain-containing protein [Armatimonadota bacterium]
MRSQLSLLRRATYLSLGVLGIAATQWGCSDTTTAFAGGVRVDQLVRDIAVTVTDTTALITWITPNPAPTRLEFGTTGSLGSRAGSNVEEAQHRVELTGLAPDTIYFYRVEGWGTSYRFRTMGGQRQRLAFVSDRGDGRREVYLSYEWGENVTRVTTGGGDQPSLSADGTRLAWVAPGPGGLLDVFSAQLDTAGLVPATTTNVTATADREEQNPDWSPDGARLVFSAAGPGLPSQLVIRTVAGGAETVIMAQNGQHQEPDWRRDGSQIAFASTTRTATIQLSRRPVDPGSVTVVLNVGSKPTLAASEFELYDAAAGLVDLSGSTATDRDVLVSYTSGGQAVAEEGHHVPRAHLEIYAVNPDGSAVRRLTESGDRDVRTQPHWHPTQALLVLVYEAGAATNIGSIPAAGGSPTGITGGAVRDRNPVISPTGNLLLFSSDRHPDGLVNLYLSDFNGNVEELNLFSSGETQPDWSVVP